MSPKPYSRSYTELPTFSAPSTQERTKYTFSRVFSVLLVMFAAAFTVKQVYPGLRNALKGGVRCHHEGANFKGLPTYYTLDSGDKIPTVALGVWKAQKGEVGDAVKTALKAGYRHIDDAWIYGNEKEVGDALKESDVPRKDLWLTSKLWNTFHAPEDVEPTLDESLLRLGVDYLDLYLIHWPVALNKDGSSYNRELTEDPYPTWQKLEELVEKGKIKNIGISNFNIPRIQNLTANPLKIKPAVLQVELNYFLPQPDLIKFAKENGIIVEAYSPLGSDGRVGKTLSLPVVKEIAEETGQTPAQVIISWHVQRGTVVLPKSVTPSRIAENYHVQALPEELFKKLETAATSHTPERGLNPSKSWGLDFDIFE